MPLPSLSHGAKQCTVLTKRTKQPCKNPAAYGCRTCRLHGARKQKTIKRGEQHPNFVHGQRSLEAQAETSRKLCELRYLEDIGHAIGMMKGGGTPGRPPKGYLKLSLSKKC